MILLLNPMMEHGMRVDGMLKKIKKHINSRIAHINFFL